MRVRPTPVGGEGTHPAATGNRACRHNSLYLRLSYKQTLELRNNGTTEQYVWQLLWRFLVPTVTGWWWYFHKDQLPEYMYDCVYIVTFQGLFFGQIGVRAN